MTYLFKGTNPPLEKSLNIGEDGVNWPFFCAKWYISKLKTYFWTLSPLAGVSIILLCWDVIVNLKWLDKCLYSKFGILKRSAERPNSPTSGVIWPGEWGYLADLLFWGQKLMSWTSKLPRRQWRLFCTHFVGLTPCWTQFRTFWLSSGMNKYNISVTSSDLDFFEPYTQLCTRITVLCKNICF